MSFSVIFAFLLSSLEKLSWILCVCIFLFCLLLLLLLLLFRILFTFSRFVWCVILYNALRVFVACSFTKKTTTTTKTMISVKCTICTAHLSLKKSHSQSIGAQCGRRIWNKKQRFQRHDYFDYKDYDMKIHNSITTIDAADQSKLHVRISTITQQIYSTQMDFIFFVCLLFRN